MTRVVKITLDSDVSNGDLASYFAVWLQYLAETNPHIALIFGERIVVSSGHVNHVVSDFHSKEGTND